MNSAIEQAILTLGSSWALSTLLKATLVMALGLCVAALAGRQRAAFRHALLAGTFGVLLALPLVSALAPPIGIVVPGSPLRNSAKPIAASGRTAALAAAQKRGIPADSHSARWSIADLLAALWIAGIAVFLLPAAAGLRQVLRLRRSGLPWRPGQSVADGLALRRVDVLLSEELAGPMTCGIARPAIVLPVDAPNWESGDLNRAIVHELEHVARRDWPIHCVARAICAVYWFHPLVWMAWRRLELEAERACDDAVLERSEPTAYADQLVAIAQRLSAAAKFPLTAMASRADLASRVNAVLDGRQRRGRAGALCVTVATVAAAALVVTVSPLRMVAAPQPASGAQNARLRTDTRLVVTQVKVSYPNGNIVEGLGAGDFEIAEDGVPQSLRICEFQKADGADPGSAYYILGYYPRITRADGQFRKIEVTVKTATAAKVEHRAGYYMTDPPSIVESSVRPPAGAAAPPYDKPPVILFKKDAEYSEAARKAKYQGTVLLDLEIDDSGRAGNIRVARSLGLDLDENAMDALRQWRFKPATKDGKPVAAQVQVEVNFRLL
jgi:TonB family protein